MAHGLTEAPSTPCTKLNCKEDLEALKNIEIIYKEESHIHQFIIPFETAVCNE